MERVDLRLANLKQNNMAIPRGIRNNNPLNMRHDDDLWLGEVRPSQDRSFKQFKTMAWGYRAAFKLLHNYSKYHDCEYLEEFISRWAPECENNTRAYIRNVAKRSGVDDIQKLNTLNGEQMQKVVAAMSWVENGWEPDLAQVREGWELFMQNR